MAQSNTTDTYPQKALITDRYRHDALTGLHSVPFQMKVRRWLQLRSTISSVLFTPIEKRLAVWTTSMLSAPMTISFSTILHTVFPAAFLNVAETRNLRE